MLISPAYAQAAGAAQAGLFESMLPLVLIFGVFYFLLIRPQQKKQKAHKATLNAIRRGDRIVTGGGILGIVVKVIDEGELKVEIADGVKVRVDRGLVSAVIAKPEAADKANDDDDDDDDADDATDANDSGDASNDDDKKPAKKSAKKGGLKKLLKD